jgi:hypothetical protein
MKKILYCSALALFLITSCKSNENKEETAAPPADSAAVAAAPADSTVKGTQYTCPMHPEVITSDSGACPKCGMPLEVKS